MWHSIERLAENQFLDEGVTRKVAIENAGALSIVNGMVSTANADDLIRLCAGTARLYR